MFQVNVAEAKSQFSKLLARVMRGESVTICRHNKPVAELRPIVAARRRGKRRLGTAKGLIEVGPAFFDDAWITDLFEGKETGGTDPL